MSQNVNPWMVGDCVIVQIPEDDGCFKTFSGVIVDPEAPGGIEVSPSRNGENVICQPEWLYPEGWLS